MSDTILLGNGVVATPCISDESAEPRIVPNGAVVWRGDRILGVGPEANLRREFPDAGFMDAHGGLIIPGLINLHHHFYSALARGLDPNTPMKDFGEVLDRLWWRLDRALDLEAVRISAQLSAADCIRSGCTTVFDHHASPQRHRRQPGYDRRRDGRRRPVGGTVYEVTDRNGHDQAVAGLDENLRFVRQRQRPGFAVSWGSTRASPCGTRP